MTRALLQQALEALYPLRPADAQGRGRVMPEQRDVERAQATITAIREYLSATNVAAQPEQEVDLNPETFLRLLETIKYMVGIAERGRGYKCPDSVLPEKFLLEYVIELEASPSLHPKGDE